MWQSLVNVFRQIQPMSWELTPHHYVISIKLHGTLWGSMQYLNYHQHETMVAVTHLTIPHCQTLRAQLMMSWIHVRYYHSTTWSVFCFSFLIKHWMDLLNMFSISPALDIDVIWTLTIDNSNQTPGNNL